MKMECDKTAGDQREKREDEGSKGRSAADLVSDRGMRKEEEDNGGPAMRTRARKRSREEAGPCQDSLAADLETVRKVKEEEDGRPAKMSRGSEWREEAKDDDSQKISLVEREGEDKKGNPNLKSRVVQRRKKQHEETPAQDVLPSSSSSREEQGVPDMVSHCPDLVQDKIFEKLSLRDKVRVAQVCSTWRNAVYRPSHWRGQTAKLEEPKQVVCSLMKRRINSIRLPAPCKDLKEVLVEFSSLESLSLSSRNTDILLKSLSVERFGSLRQLILYIGTKLLMKRLKKCLPCFPNLVHLKVTGFVTTCLLEAIVDELKGLEILSFHREARCSLILNVEALGQLERLQDLYLEGFQLEGFEKLSQVSSTLHSLHLWNCDISGDEWTPVLSQLRALTFLAFVGCWPVLDSAGLRLLAQELPNLKSFACGNDSSPRFGISIPEEDWVSDDHMSAVAEMPGLQAFSLCFDTCITDSGVVALCTRLSTLTSLEILECNQITSKSIECISNLSSLTVLQLAYGRDGEKWLEILAKGSCKLRYLKLHEFETSGDGMQHLAQMSTLSHILLWHVGVGPAGMAHLSKATFHLESLEIVDCGITVDGLTPLLQRQTSLRRLILVETKGTSRSKVPFLKKILPHLEKCSVFNWRPKGFSWSRLRLKLK